MPLYRIDGGKMRLSKAINFPLEKDIQKLIESNLDAVFNCRFVATEFSTGAEHAGRIDTLALSEDNSPVIIEYKKVESSELVNQSLYYLSWIKDHKGDFQVAVNKALGRSIEVDWSEVRVICIAPGYKKYDLHAVQMMGQDIELWQYRLFDNDCMGLDEVFRRKSALGREVVADPDRKAIMSEAGRKAAITKLTGAYSIEEHLKHADTKTAQLVGELREFIQGMSDSVEESPKKLYVAYKTTQNFVCMEIKKLKVTLYLKLDPKVEPLLPNCRDTTDIGHFGTGDYEVTISNSNEIGQAMELIKSHLKMWADRFVS